MQLLIQRAIELEAKKRLARFSRDQYYIHKYRNLFSKRTTKKPKISKHKLPNSWSFHKQFDPRYCLNHSSFLAKGVWSSLMGGTYRLVPALRSKILKPSGGYRHVDSFSIPDAAIAKIFLKNLRSRNSKIFSDSSYAYQDNKTPLDAIIKIKSVLDSKKIFISQYDFSKFFDSITHDYIERLIGHSGPFLTTHMERRLLKAVLTHSFVEAGGSPEKRTQGIPQGHSLSLFLANAAADLSP